ncbi:MAG: hypothetical protein PHW60_12560 [Kiritimatiellae bacterium]|nr:hypothetical protein [Kiritimatiellia bacterium]
MSANISRQEILDVITVSANGVVTVGGEKRTLELCGQTSAVILRNISVKPGKRYKLSFMVKAGAKTVSVTGFQRFSVLVSWPPVKEERRLFDTWENNFQRKELILTVPVGAVVNCMAIRYTLVDDGSLHLKDFVLEEHALPEADEVTIVVHRPFCRNIIYASDPVSEITGLIAAKAWVKSVTLSLVDKKNGATVYRQKYSNATGEIPFVIPAKHLAFGKYLLTAAPLDDSGRPLRKPAETEIWKLEKSPVEIIYKEDRNFYINGKPFYPVVFWEIDGVQANTPENELLPALYYLSKNGVNTIWVNGIVPPDRALFLLESAKKNHAKIIFSFFEEVAKTDSGSLVRWENGIKGMLAPAVLAHEALFGYFMSDEPLWLGVPLENLESCYRVLKEIDPYRPIWINEAPRGERTELGEFARPCDIWGADIYPVPVPNSHSELEDKGLTAVGKYTTRMRASVHGRKPVWMILQGFAWETLSKRKGTTYPDFLQSRFMAFDAIVNGANAITYYGMTFIDTLSFYDVLFDITGRLRELSGVLVLPEAPENSVKVDDANIRFSARQADGIYYVIAVNESDQARDISFKLNFEAKYINVVFENRKIECRPGIISDRFSPYDVHIYATGNLPPVVTPVLPENIELEATTPIFLKKASGQI